MLVLETKTCSSPLLGSAPGLMNKGAIRAVFGRDSLGEGLRQAQREGGGRSGESTATPRQPAEPQSRTIRPRGPLPPSRWHGHLISFACCPQLALEAEINREKRPTSQLLGGTETGWPAFGPAEHLVAAVHCQVSWY